MLLPEPDRVQDLALGDFARARFDHHHLGGAADHHQVETAALHLLVGGVQDELAVDETDAHGGDRGREGDIGDVQRRRGAGDRQDVGVVGEIGREHQGDDLRLAGPALREERPDRSVDQARRQGLLLVRAALAFEEAARDLAGGIGVLAVIDGQRQEGDALLLAPVRGRGHQDHGVAVAHRDRAVGLFGHLAGLDGEGPAAEFQVACRGQVILLKRGRCGRIERTRRHPGPVGALERRGRNGEGWSSARSRGPADRRRDLCVRMRGSVRKGIGV